MVAISSGLSQWELSFVLAPIILVGGIAGSVSGGMAPITSYIQASSYPGGLTGAAQAADPNNSFAFFKPLGGATLIDNQVATYPFVNQTTAANAIITNPLKVSLLMTCPARGSGSYFAKQATLTALQKTLAQHINQGGTFNVVTPAYIYTNCLLVALRDVTGAGADSIQPQIEWQWDFMQPLVTLSDIAAAQNSAMSKISGQSQNSGDPPGSLPIQTAIGLATSGLGPSLIPAAASLLGASVAGQIQSGLNLVNQVQSGINQVRSGNVGGVISAAQSIRSLLP